MNPAKPLFQVILATPNASDLIRQTELIRSKDRTWSAGLLGENWATASVESDQKSRKDEKQMEIFSLLAHEKCFPCCCGNLFSLHDTRSLLSLYLRIFIYRPDRVHIKGLLIINHKSAWIIVYSACDVCLHLHFGPPPPAVIIHQLNIYIHGLLDWVIQGPNEDTRKIYCSFSSSVTSGKLTLSLMIKTRMDENHQRVSVFFEYLHAGLKNPFCA